MDVVIFIIQIRCDRVCTLERQILSGSSAVCGHEVEKYRIMTDDDKDDQQLAGSCFEST